MEKPNCPWWQCESFSSYTWLKHVMFHLKNLQNHVSSELMCSRRFFLCSLLHSGFIGFAASPVQTRVTLASSATSTNEYLIHPDYPLIWFNVVCMVKHNATTAKMHPDNPQKEVVCSYRWPLSSAERSPIWLSFHLSLAPLLLLLHLTTFNWSSIFLTKLQSKCLMEMPWGELD